VSPKALPGGGCIHTARRDHNHGYFGVRGRRQRSLTVSAPEDYLSLAASPLAGQTRFLNDGDGIFQADMRQNIPYTLLGKLFDVIT
jgi:hypothetical protein